MTVRDLQQLRELYRDARGKIIKFSDDFERDIGLAALRLEATHTYRELQTTSVGMTDQTIAPLKDYVPSLTGGKNVEALVENLDREAQNFAKKVLRTLWALLNTGIWVGGFGVIASVVLGVALSAEKFGATLFGTLIAGGAAAAMVIRGGYTGATAGQHVWESTWGWASGLGRSADAALVDARREQKDLVRRAAGGGLPIQSFTDKVRVRAQLVIGFAWTTVGVACALVVFGFYQAADKRFSTPSASPQTQTTSPVP